MKANEQCKITLIKNSEVPTPTKDALTSLKEQKVQINGKFKLIKSKQIRSEEIESPERKFT